MCLSLAIKLALEKFNLGETSGLDLHHLGILVGEDSRLGEVTVGSTATARIQDVHGVAVDHGAVEVARGGGVALAPEQHVNQLVIALVVDAENGIDLLRRRHAFNLARDGDCIVHTLCHVESVQRSHERRTIRAAPVQAAVVVESEIPLTLDESDVDFNTTPRAERSNGGAVVLTHVLRLSTRGTVRGGDALSTEGVADVQVGLVVGTRGVAGGESGARGRVTMALPRSGAFDVTVGSWALRVVGAVSDVARQAGLRGCVALVLGGRGGAGRIALVLGQRARVAVVAHAASRSLRVGPIAAIVSAAFFLEHTSASPVKRFAGAVEASALGLSWSGVAVDDFAGAPAAKTSRGPNTLGAGREDLARVRGRVDLHIVGGVGKQARVVGLEKLVVGVRWEHGAEVTRRGFRAATAHGIDSRAVANHGVLVGRGSFLRVGSTEEESLLLGDVRGLPRAVATSQGDALHGTGRKLDQNVRGHGGVGLQGPCGDLPVGALERDLWALGTLLEAHVVLALAVAGLDHHTAPDALQQRGGIRVAQLIALVLRRAGRPVAESVVAVRKRALGVVGAVVSARLALLHGGANDDADGEVAGKRWSLVAVGFAVGESITLARGSKNALPGGCIARVTLLAGLGGVHTVAVPVVVRLVLATRADGAVFVHGGCRRAPTAEFATDAFRASGLAGALVLGGGSRHKSEQ